jgi:hypothetical protein
MAPLLLSCTPPPNPAPSRGSADLDRRECQHHTPRPGVPTAHRPTVSAPGEREHSDPKGHAVRVPRGDRLTAAPGTGAVIAIAEGEPLTRVPPATSSVLSARGIEAGTAETRSGSVHESPVRRSRTRPNGKPREPERINLREPRRPGHKCHPAPRLSRALHGQRQRS